MYLTTQDLYIEIKEQENGLGFRIRVECKYIYRGVHRVKVRVTMACSYIDRGVPEIWVRFRVQGGEIVV